jgi:hypothetical protein
LHDKSRAYFMVPVDEPPVDGPVPVEEPAPVDDPLPSPPGEVVVLEPEPIEPVPVPVELDVPPAALGKP